MASYTNRILCAAEEGLQEPGFLNTFFGFWEKSTRVNKTLLYFGIWFILIVIVLSGWARNVICPLVGFGFPVYHLFKLLLSGRVKNVGSQRPLRWHLRALPLAVSGTLDYFYGETLQANDLYWTLQTIYLTSFLVTFAFYLIIKINLNNPIKENQIPKQVDEINDEFKSGFVYRIFSSRRPGQGVSWTGVKIPDTRTQLNLRYEL